MSKFSQYKNGGVDTKEIEKVASERIENKRKYIVISGAGYFIRRVPV